MRRQQQFLILAVFFLASLGAAPGPARAQGGDGSLIAVISDRQTIDLLSPEDGSARTIYALPAGTPPEFGLQDVGWTPSAEHVLFTSAQEPRSLWDADLWSIRFTGAGLKRLTNAPNPAADPRPAGAVLLKIGPQLQSTVVEVYVQGGRRAARATTSTREDTTVVIEDVVDFGPRVPQRITVRSGVSCLVEAMPAVDILPGRPVVVPEPLPLLASTLGSCPRAMRPIAHHDGRAGFLLQTKPFAGGQLFEQRDLWLADGEGRDGQLGELAIDFAAPFSSGDRITHAVPGPTAATADQVVFAQGTGVYLTSLESPGRTTPLYVCPRGGFWPCRITGLTWLPDGSGVLFAAEENPRLFDDTSRVFYHDLASRSSVPIVTLRREYIVDVTVSPDGGRIAFARGPSATGPWSVWTASLLGTDLRLLAEGARSPAWSPREPALEPSITTPRVVGSPLPTLRGEATPGARVDVRVAPTAPAGAELAAEVRFLTTADGAGRWAVDLATATAHSGGLPRDGFPPGTVLNLTVTAQSPSGGAARTVTGRITVGWATLLLAISA